MTQEPCPYCGEPREATLDWHRDVLVQADGKEKRVLIIELRCRQCGTLIRSTKVPEEEGTVEPHEEFFLD
jgi:rubrerythrin